MPARSASSRYMDGAIGRRADIIAYERWVKRRIMARYASLARRIRELTRGVESGTYSRREVRRIIREIEEEARQWQREAGAWLSGHAKRLQKAAARHAEKAIADATGMQPRPASIDTLERDPEPLGVPVKLAFAAAAAMLARKVAALVRTSAATGSDNAAMIGAVIRRGRAHVITEAVTAVSGAHTAGEQAAYDANSSYIDGLMAVVVFDSRTSDICMSRSSAVWSMDGSPQSGTTIRYPGPPPWHPNCRTMIVPVFKTADEIKAARKLSKRRQRALDGKKPPVTDFGRWMRRQPRQYVEQKLGKERAELFLEGKITLRDLVDKSGRTITIEELERL